MSREEGIIFYMKNANEHDYVQLSYLTHAPDYPERLFWTTEKSAAVVFTLLDEDVRDFLKDFDYYKTTAIAYRELILIGAPEKFDRINNGQ